MRHAPNSKQLEKRVHELFGIRTYEHAQQQTASPYVIPTKLQEFEVPLSGSPTAQTNGSDAADAWLKTPHPAFDGLCPEVFMKGNERQRFFFASFLASVKDGAFS